MELDYAILAHDAAYNGEATDIKSAGADTMFATSLPASLSGLVLFNFWMNRHDLRSDHRVEALLIDADGHPLPGVSFRSFDFPAPPNPPETDGYIPYKLRGAIKLNTAIVMKMGNYAIDLRLDDHTVKRIPFVVQPLPES